MLTDPARVQVRLEPAHNLLNGPALMGSSVDLPAQNSLIYDLDLTPTAEQRQRRYLVGISLPYTGLPAGLRAQINR